MRYTVIPGVGLFRTDSTGRPGVFNSTGSELAYFDATTGALTFTTSSSAPGSTIAGISNDGSNNLFFNVPTGLAFAWYHNGVQTMQMNTSSISKLHGLTTAGLGVPAIVGAYSTTGNTAGVTNAINYTPAAVAGTYRISFYIDVTAFTSGGPAASFSYTDATGTARTDNVVFTRENSTTLVTTLVAVDRYDFTGLFQINNAAAAITASTTDSLTNTYALAIILERLV